jgi:hypothetical protein
MIQNPFELDDRSAVAVVAYASEILNQSVGPSRARVEQSATECVNSIPELNKMRDFEQSPPTEKGAVCREIIARGLLSDDDFVHSTMRGAMLRLERVGAQAIDPFSILAFGVVAVVILIVCKVEYDPDKGWALRKGPDPNKALQAITELVKKLPG